MPGRTQGGFPPECSPGAAPPGNGISKEASPEALLRGYMPGGFSPPGPPWRAERRKEEPQLKICQ